MGNVGDDKVARDFKQNTPWSVDRSIRTSLRLSARRVRTPINNTFFFIQVTGGSRVAAPA